MVGVVVRRFFQLILLLIGISFLVFTSMYIAPGDPAAIIAGPTASQADIDAIREDLGLNDPFLVQYGRYMNGLLHGDLGYSYQTKQPVWDAIATRFPNTLKLAIASIIVAVIIGVVAGIISAIRQNSWFDVSSTIFALAGISIPNFWLGTVLILIFAVNLQLLPVGGLDAPFYTAEGLKQLVLPAITLGTGSAAMIARMSRSSMLEVIRADFIRTARAKGVRERTVIWVHALRNAMIPVITVIGLNFGFLLGGTIITEQVFAINGVGRLMVQAIAARDFPMVQGSVLLVATLFVLVNLIVDIIYTFIDPRISYD
ncbi:MULTISPECIES: nickel ABC transporter permease [Geobacillus]|jgi:peptide/nickel transport system permease protein|uniref:nickel ABC transporter permease n=1 Tax=Geobacillus TaxID=129337 RepID=UPI00040E0AC3|nr:MULTISPECIES: nickel ABC transporter permease [Geobacillus]ARA98298.1 peptide ABC transporter permease [Geobacillus thermodenitrificans]MED0663327.1 ABC transporter permease [Geobacillus thermodenitrificans]MED4918096.1 ABC transporter permease [Geobacillus thermodenitrificans]PJW20076.1 ABC transporter permease [Geobacillus thermodenitrificans]PTR47679.1 ABC transporter permease [Geobacillus thermodenitrificans]